MIDPHSTSNLACEVQAAIDAQRDELERLRAIVRILRNDTHRIKPRSTTSISIVGTDGGNNKVQFDPFVLQMVRVVDSNEHDHCLEIISPTSNFDDLMRRHLKDGVGITPLGRMMTLLGVNRLPELSSMILDAQHEPKASWVQVYRELQEWAVLLEMVRVRDYAADTLVIRDGWLRTKVFAPGKFQTYRRLLETAIADQFRKRRRRIYVAGVLKRSKVLQKFQLSMMLEGVLRNTFPCYVRVPATMQAEVFRWHEIIGGSDASLSHRRDAENMVAGEMFFVKFGSRPHDQVWVVDLLNFQVEQASTTLGYMLADALNGFPVPFYPMSLQRAHENAAIEGFDVEILQNHVSDAVRRNLGADGPLVDELELAESEAAGKN
jgi:hypothetical protein